MRDENNKNNDCLGGVIYHTRNVIVLGLFTLAMNQIFIQDNYEIRMKTEEEAADKIFYRYDHTKHFGPKVKMQLSNYLEFH